MLSLAGVYPYACNNCRNRFWALREGAVVQALAALIVLAAAVVLVVWAVWHYQSHQRPAVAVQPAPAPATSPAARGDIQMRDQVEALANRLVEVRREKAALQAELVALRRQLAEMTKAPPPPAVAAPPVDSPPTPLRTTAPVPSPPAAAVPPPPPPPPAPAPRYVVTGKTLLGRITFASGSTAIDPENLGLLKGIAQRLSQTPGVRVLLVGASDATPMGSRTATLYQDNTGLAMARALSVFRSLRDLGVELERMEVTTTGAPDQEVGAGRMVKIWLMPAGRGNLR